MIEKDEYIERRILVGLITSTEYLQEVEKIWSPAYIESVSAKTLANWCFEYFHKYNKAPGKEIESVFISQAENLDDTRANDLGVILESLSDDFVEGSFNFEYLLDQTRDYFNKQHLLKLADDIKDNVEDNDIENAEKIASSFSMLATDEARVINPFSDPMLVKEAFIQDKTPLIYFPKALGKFLNSQLVRNSFVAFMGPEKRGKTFLLMELAVRGVMAKKNVVFFQAGDMTEEQQIRRLAIYFSKKSDRERYCKGMYVPVLDCWYNQTDTCDFSERECNFGIFSNGMNQKEVTKEMLEQIIQQNNDYLPCRNCPKMKGAVWLKWSPAVSPLTWKEAYKEMRKWKKKHSGQLKLCTYANETLSIREIYSLLDDWERREDFKVDVIIIDYADILAPDKDISKLDWRNQQNKIWQRLRSLSQQKNCLVVTATQAAASSYVKESMSLSDFSEDKRKFAHVTAMYGLNQLPEEKKLGILRLNELVVRDDVFDSTKEVKILQCLQQGRPFIGSYF